MSSACCVQLPALRVNTSAEPASLPAPVLSLCAPTSAVSPDTATETPKLSPAPGSSAVKRASRTQLVPSRINSEAEPAPAPAEVKSPCAPSSAVSADNATARPKVLPPPAILACCVQVEPLRVKTYAEWVKKAPISAVSPKSATAMPNPPPPPSLALSFACSPQVPSLRTKTYAAPVSVAVGELPAFA